jgi:hypothetical protein
MIWPGLGPGVRSTTLPATRERRSVDHFYLGYAGRTFKEVEPHSARETLLGSFIEQKPNVSVRHTAIALLRRRLVKRKLDAPSAVRPICRVLCESTQPYIPERGGQIRSPTFCGRRPVDSGLMLHFGNGVRRSVTTSTFAFFNALKGACQASPIPSMRPSR